MDERLLVIMPGSNEPLVLARPSRCALGSAQGLRAGDQSQGYAPGTQGLAPPRPLPAWMPGSGTGHSRNGTPSHNHRHSLGHSHSPSHSSIYGPAHNHSHRHRHSHTGNRMGADGEAEGRPGAASAIPWQAQRLPEGSEQARRQGGSQAERESRPSWGHGQGERQVQRLGLEQAQGEEQEQGEGERGEGRRRGRPLDDLRRTLSNACTRLSLAMVGKGMPTRDGWQSAIQAAAMSHAFFC